jgi:uncharacterized membrane protein
MKPAVDGDARFVASVRRFVSMAAPGLPRDCWLEALLTHPAYPNVLAVLDAVRAAGIEGEAVRADASTIGELSLPSLLYIPHAPGGFAVLERVEKDRLLWSHPDGRRWVSRSAALRSWSGIAVVVKEVVTAGRRGLCVQRAGPRLEAPAVVGLLAAALVAIAVSALGGRGALALTSLSIQIAGVLLALFVGSSPDGSHLAQELCPAGTVFDCRRVLHSGASSFLGVALSDWAAGYFLAGAISMVAGFVAGSASSGMHLWAWLSILGALTAVGSLVYQAAVVRAGCAGCLAIDALLLLQCALLWKSRGPLDGAAWRIGALGSWAAVALVIAWRTGRRTDRQGLWRYHGLKRDPIVFAALLGRAQPVTLPIPSSGLISGDPAAPLRVTMVTSPYCPACATAYRELAPLAHSPDVRLTLVFLCNGEEDLSGDRAVVTAHALAGEGRMDDARTLLDSWFGAIAAGRPFDDTPLNDLYRTLPPESLARARFSLREQQQWSASIGVAAAPMLLVNGRPLPSQYEPADLAAVDAAALALAVRSLEQRRLAAR